jgi:hypothetical protein
MIEQITDVCTVIRMLVRQKQFRCRNHGPGFVTVHPRDLVGPFPAFTGEPEAEAADVQVSRGGDLGRAGRLLARSVRCRRAGSPGPLHGSVIPPGGFNGERSGIKTRCRSDRLARMVRVGGNVA